MPLYRVMAGIHAEREEHGMRIYRGPKTKVNEQGQLVVLTPGEVFESPRENLHLIFKNKLEPLTLEPNIVVSKGELVNSAQSPSELTTAQGIPSAPPPGVIPAVPEPPKEPEPVDVTELFPRAEPLGLVVLRQEKGKFFIAKEGKRLNEDFLVDNKSVNDFLRNYKPKEE